MRRTQLIVSLCLSTAGSASANSIGSYSGCKKLKGAAAEACTRCVEGGNFYQSASGTCGLTAGMKPSKAAKSEKPPPKPAAMPKSKFVTVPPGSFEIGARPDEEGSDAKELFEATVRITRPFQMKTTEVTQAEWYFVMGEPSVSYDKACGMDCAVGHVTWRRALDYLNALSKKEGLEPCYAFKEGLGVWTKGLDCKGYRLPTEAEWEYAARGGTETARYGELDEIAWHRENSGGEPKPVGKKKPNDYGLHDMIGSHWEWTWDAYEYKPFEGEMTDPITGGLAQDSAAQDRIIRGGSYRDNWVAARASHRFQYLADSGDVSHGFRPVRTVSDK